MALNWVMLDDNRSPLPLTPEEMVIHTVDAGVSLILRVPDVPPSNTASSGGFGASKTLEATGSLQLTDRRLIFVSESPSSTLDSLSTPLPSVLSTQFEQPRFRSNYLTFEIQPSREGGLTYGTTAELRFTSQPMFVFVSLLEKTRERAIYMKRTSSEDEESLPIYTADAECSASTSRPQEENPPQYDD